MRVNVIEPAVGDTTAGSVENVSAYFFGYAAAAFVPNLSDGWRGSQDVTVVDECLMCGEFREITRSYSFTYVDDRPRVGVVLLCGTCDGLARVRAEQAGGGEDV